VAFACTFGQIRFRNYWTAGVATASLTLRTMDEGRAERHSIICIGEGILPLDS
jgi:hypothetical protein